MPENNLYKFHATALKSCEAGPQFNWKQTFECAATDLAKLEMSDVKEEAASWRSEDVPADFYFTHAKFYKDGIKNIIRELKDKPTSNRALYSLISQEHIRETLSDDPIPSFMVFQCQLDGDILYCTSYFRALEVSRFFKINLEEIRQNLYEIHTKLPEFSKIQLTVFAFRAYIDEERSALRRPKFESLPDDELLSILTNPNGNPVRQLESMLRELREAVTIVSAEKLKSLKRIVSNSRTHLKVPEELSKPIFVEKIDIAISCTKSLAELRRKQSHGEAVEEATKQYRAAIDALCAAIDI